MRVEWRREDVSPPADTARGSAALTESIRDDIERDGPVTFARFMERALYHPVWGYYATDAARPTREGDFLTAPELHPIFGRTLAVQVEEMWQRLGRPGTFVIREFGAGSGALFLSIVEGLARLDLPSLPRFAMNPSISLVNGP